MASCRTAPSHYLNQCWLIINEVLWHSLDVSFTGNAEDIYPSYEFKNLRLYLNLISQCVNMWLAIILMNADPVDWSIYSSHNKNKWTLWDQNKMSNILQITFSNAFSEKKVVVFQIKFLLSLFLSGKLTVMPPLHSSHALHDVSTISK